MIPSADALWADCQREQGRLIVVTGEIGAGKTTWCSALIARARASGGRIAGLLSPGVFVDGQKVAIDLLDLASGQRRRLAERLAIPDPTSPTPRWRFDAETLAWGDAVLRAVEACDLLVIDELGPLELVHGQGWRSAVPLLERRQYRAACVVVRRSLLSLIAAAFPEAKVIALDPT
jgi:nucleoside-triphosphatase THEP1